MPKGKEKGNCMAVGSSKFVSSKLDKYSDKEDSALCCFMLILSKGLSTIQAQLCTQL